MACLQTSAMNHDDEFENSSKNLLKMEEIKQKSESVPFESELVFDETRKYRSFVQLVRSKKLIKLSVLEFSSHLKLYIK